jgi:uncharacterized protein YoxC
MITFDCPHCGYRLQVDEAFAGRDGWCRICKKLIAVPSHDAKTPEDLTPTEQYARLTKAFQYAATKADRYQALFVKLRDESQQRAAHADDIRRLAEQVQTLEKRLADVESTLAQLSKSTSPLPLAAVQDALARLEDLVAGTTTRVETMESVAQQFEGSRSEVEQAKSELAELGRKLDAERDARKEVEGMVDQTRALVEAFHASVQDFTSKVDRLPSAASPIAVETDGGPPDETRPPSDGESEVVVLSELAEEEAQGDSQAMLGTFLRFIGPSQENTL